MGALRNCAAKRSFNAAVTLPGGPRCPALPVADKAGHKRVQRSARDEGILAEDIRRAPQTDWEAETIDQSSCVLTAAARRKRSFCE